MNRTNLLLTACVSACVAYGCSQTGPNATTGTPAASGGSTSSSQTNASDSGGSESSSNAQAQGGSENNSSEVKSQGGSKQTSKSEAKGGSVAAGGAADSGGESGNGEGGSSSEETKPAEGGSSTKTTVAKGGATAAGGNTGAGGTSAKATTEAAKGGATTATGGASSATGGATTASSGGVTPKDIVPDLAAGFYWEGTCKGSQDPKGRNCWLTADSTCPNGGINVEKVFDVKGVKDQLYTVNIEVRGVLGTRCYMNGKRASTAAPSETGNNNWWYIGGVYTNSTGWWNTYELKVSPSTGDASGDIYYFNGLDTSVEGGKWCEKEATYLQKYTASFKVKGGGTMTFKIHDQNCKAQQNCGGPVNSGDETCTPRTVDLTGMAVQPPATFKQPPTNSTNKTYYPQWAWIVASSVTSP